MKFHEALVAAAHNRALSAQFKALRSVLEPIYARRNSKSIAREVIASNKRIVEAIAAGDAERARNMIRQRLEAVRAYQITRRPERESGTAETTAPLVNASLQRRDRL